MTDEQVAGRTRIGVEQPPAACDKSRPENNGVISEPGSDRGQPGENSRAPCATQEVTAAEEGTRRRRGRQRSWRKGTRGGGRVTGREATEDMIFGIEAVSEVVEEAASQQRQHPRRSSGQRADHLLRFRAPAREANGSAPGESSRRADATRRRRQVRRRPTGVDGAFENSSLRLMVVHSEAVSALASDVDRAVDWNLVCAMESSHAVECAICLDEPKAPVAGSCGHIFCAACVVHHASMLEVSRSKRCPCCNRPLSTSELRPVRFTAVAAVEEGAEHGVFVLLERHRQSRAAAPFRRRNANEDDNSMASSWPSLPVATLEKPECCVYSKLTVADSDDVVRGVFDRLSDELGAAAAAAESECAAQDVALAVAVMSSVRAAFLERNLGQRPPHHPEEQDDREHPEDSQPFFFYGRADGEPTYLHPLALRCLLAAVDAKPALLPRTISLVAPPRTVDRFEQCAESRRRLPWLGHIQLGCEVALVDCDLEALGDDWGPRAVQARDADPVLLSAFAQRDERLKRDRERRRKAERKLRAKAAKGSPQLPDRATLDELRTIRSFALNEDDFAPLTTASPPKPGTLVLGASPEEPSFAALVAKGFAAELGCPALGSSSSRAQSPPTVWNRPPSAPDRALDYSPPEPFAPPPPERQVVSRDFRFNMPPDSTQAWAGALESVLRSDEQRRVSAQDTSAQKKKKEKRTVFLLTGGGRRYS